MKSKNKNYNNFDKLVLVKEYKDDLLESIANLPPLDELRLAVENERLEAEDEMIKLLNGYKSLEEFKKIFLSAKSNNVAFARNFFILIENFISSKKMNNEEKNMTLYGDDGCLFFIAEALDMGFETMVKPLADLRKNKGIEQSFGCINDFLNKKQFDKALKIISLSTNLEEKGGLVLRALHYNDFRDFAVYDDLLEKYNIDINKTWKDEDYTDDKKLRLVASFAQSVIFGDNNFGLMSSFLKKYGKKVELGALFKYIPEGKEANSENFLVITTVAALDRVNYAAAMRSKRISCLMEYCNINEGIMAEIANLLLEPDMVASQYSDGVYEKMFKHPAFNSSNFDREMFLNKLVLLDFNRMVIDERKKQNNFINPVLTILNQYISHAKRPDFSNENPIERWLEKDNKMVVPNTDVFELLVKYYKDDFIQKKTSFKNKNITKNKDFLKLLEDEGLIEKKVGILGRMFGKKQENVSVAIANVETVRSVVDKLNKVDTVLFNDVLYAQVYDEEIKKYIASIRLNAEQFDFMVSAEVKSEKEKHYIDELLPKFLNSSVENYISFRALDEDEAKENLLVQLKLLNKKTAEMLSDCLVSERDLLKNKAEINKKIIKSY